MATEEHTAKKDITWVDVRLRFVKPGLAQPLYQDFAKRKGNVKFEPAPHEQRLFDARTCGPYETFSLDKCGFSWLNDPTSLSHDDFKDEKKRMVYQREVAQLLKYVTGADCVSVYSSRVSELCGERIGLKG